MSDEDLRRAVEFLAEQQSRYDASLAHDEARLARLEDAFVTLAELARVSNERAPSVATLSQAINDLANSIITLRSTRSPGNEVRAGQNVTLGTKPLTTPKPPKQKISDAEFRRRLKTITPEFREKRLAKVRSKNRPASDQ